MILYNAGNFPVMMVKGEESKLRQMVLEGNYPSFNRLYSFFYLEATKNALNENMEEKPMVMRVKRQPRFKIVQKETPAEQLEEEPKVEIEIVRGDKGNKDKRISKEIDHINDIVRESGSLNWLKNHILISTKIIKDILKEE